MIRTAAIAAIGLVVVLAAAPARADGGAKPSRRGTRVFPVAGADGGAITSELAAALDAEVAAVPIDDAAGVLGCTIDDDGCLAAIARQLRATRLVFATAAGDAVTLSRFDADAGTAPTHASFTLSGATPRERARGLIDEARGFLDLPAPAPTATDETSAPVPLDPPAPAPRRGHVPRYAWALIGGGALVAATGGGFLLSARSLRQDVESAPTTTRDDIDRLRSLEATGKTRTTIGDGLVIAGGAAVVTGVVLAIVHRGGGDSGPEAAARTVAIQPTTGGAIVSTQVRW